MGPAPGSTPTPPPPVKPQSNSPSAVSGVGGNGNNQQQALFQVCKKALFTQLFYQIEPLKNGASLILFSSIARSS